MRTKALLCLMLFALLMVTRSCFCAESAKPSEEQINKFLRAIKAGDMAFVKDVLERDPASANRENSHGITPLMCAIFDDQEEIVKLLVSKGADVNAKDGPLGSAAYGGCIGMMECLISNGAEINGTNYWGGTALSSAAEGGRLEAAKMLIALGAKVNAQGDFGATPLSIAVSNGHASVVKLVIDNGADVNLADKYGATPLHKATSAYTATVLIARGADVNAANEKGLTPLHMAAFYGYATVAKVLIQKGANITARTTATAYLQPDKTYADVVLPPGLTPREFAEKAGQTEVAKLLEKAEAAQAMPPETPQTP